MKGRHTTSILGVKRNLLIISRLTAKIQPEKEPLHNGICYPQADDITKVRVFVESVYDGYTTKEELVQILNMTTRQIDYYGNAARYLGFVTRRSGNFLPTSLGKELAISDKKKKKRIIIERFFKIPSIRGVFTRVIEGPLSMSTVIEAMRKAKVHLNTKKMENRRAQTIYSWVVWALRELPKVCEENI